MNLDQLKVGDSVLTMVRAINRVAGDPSKGKVLQIEVAERIAAQNLLSLALPNDERITKNKPQRGWMPFEVETFIELFNIEQTVADQLRNLTVSTGLPVSQYVEGTHFVRLNIVNPTVLGDQLRLQIKETTVKPNERAVAKINPSTKKPMLHNGEPIYRIVSIVNVKPQNSFLVADKVEEEIPENAVGRIPANRFAGNAAIS